MQAPLAQALWACWLASCWGGMWGEVMARKGRTLAASNNQEGMLTGFLLRHIMLRLGQ